MTVLVLVVLTGSLYYKQNVTTVSILWALQRYRRISALVDHITGFTFTVAVVRVSCYSFSYLSPRRQSSCASISGAGSCDDLGSTSSGSGGSSAGVGGGVGGLAARFATLRATRRKDVKDAHALTPEARRHMQQVRAYNYTCRVSSVTVHNRTIGEYILRRPIP